MHCAMASYSDEVGVAFLFLWFISLSLKFGTDSRKKPQRVTHQIFSIISFVTTIDSKPLKSCH